MKIIIKRENIKRVIHVPVRPLLNLVFMPRNQEAIVQSDDLPDERNSLMATDEIETLGHFAEILHEACVLIRASK